MNHLAFITDMKIMLSYHNLTPSMNDQFEYRQYSNQVSGLLWKWTLCNIIYILGTGQTFYTNFVSLLSKQQAYRYVSTVYETMLLG